MFLEYSKERQIIAPHKKNWRSEQTRRYRISYKKQTFEICTIAYTKMAWHIER
jgi:hypothetical protein